MVKCPDCNEPLDIDGNCRCGYEECRDLGKCNRCGSECWHRRIDSSPCSGELKVSEDYPDIWTHFCEGHGHPEDQ